MNASNGNPPRKVDALVSYMKAGEWGKAIAMAAKWPRLGEERIAIQTAASAQLSPEFYRQLGRNPEALVDEGKAALLRRYANYMGGE